MRLIRYILFIPALFAGMFLSRIIDIVTAVLLQKNDFDLVICDHSSSLLDAIFFKNKVIYFDPNNKTKGYTTHYSKYLVNLFETQFESLTKEDFYHLLSIEQQEGLLNNMITMGSNCITHLQ